MSRDLSHDTLVYTNFVTAVQSCQSNRMGVAMQTKCDFAAFEGLAGLDVRDRLAIFFFDGRSRYDELALCLLDDHVGAGRQVRNQPGIVAIDLQADRNIADVCALPETTRSQCADRVDFSGELHVREGVKFDRGMLADTELAAFCLVDRAFHLHALRVDDLHEALARENAVARLHLTHFVAAPDLAT